MDSRFLEKDGSDLNIDGVSTAFLCKKRPEFKIPS
jgi:hypothetical protein